MYPKRVAMISFHTCPLAAEEGKETGGMNIYVLELSKALSSKGVEVDIFTRNQGPDEPEIVKINNRTRVVHINAGPQKNISKKEASSYIDVFAKETAQFLHKEKKPYDVVHCHYYLSGLVGLKLKEYGISGVPLIMSFHTLALMKNLVARSEWEKENEERINAEIMLVDKADYIIASSEVDYDYLKYLYNAGEDRMRVVVPGVDTTLFRSRPSEDAKKLIGADKNEKIVLFVGRIEPLKGIDTLIYAIKIIQRRNPDLHLQLWIVGGDVSEPISLWSKEMQKLERLRLILHLHTHIKFIGQKKQHELPNYYNAADVVVMPSHYESFGMTALEAMACGTPVITTNVSGISRLFDEKHAHLVTSVQNPLLLASKIECILNHSDQQIAIGKELSEKVQDLHWANIANCIIKVYKSV